LSCTAFPFVSRGLVVEFRPPSIVLAYPASGGTLPADKPLIVFRFEPGEASDPIDPGAFRATVDGIDRSSHFRVTPTEAWGQLADSSATPSLTPGSHVVGARVCSTRGACGSVSARVEVRPWEHLLEPRRERSSRTPSLPNDNTSPPAVAREAGGDRPRPLLDRTGD
jgi:hypothetical protein